jgi:hypothetical protein
MRNFILGLSFSAVFIVGCLFGSTRSADTVPVVRSAPAGQRYAYYCIDEEDSEKITVKAKKMGRSGWRMIAAAGGGNAGGMDLVWCFEKRF